MRCARRPSEWVTTFQLKAVFEPLGDHNWRKVNIDLSDKLFTNSDRVEEGVTGSGVLDLFDRYKFYRERG